MFNIEPTPTKRPVGQVNKWVVDHGRDVSLEVVRFLSQESRQFMKLVWLDRVIPFDIVQRRVTDERTGEAYDLTTFGYFGAAFVRQHYGDNVEFYQFANDAERRQAQLLAVEALLAYGNIYNGDKQPDGYHRVEFEGKRYRKRDFGMA